MMDLTQLVDLISNTAVSIVVLGYFMYRDYKFLDSLNITLNTLVKTIEGLERRENHDNN